ncbi:transmembrane protein 26-like [Anguilla rostrata]|uniref:transmembrane protein 26-like n=1 Tax=Anguilla rostrata TaxID=7938 RepID=UPI0030D5D71F
MILKYISAIVTRVSFIILSLIAIWRVTKVKNDDLFWFLILLNVPVVVEMIISLKRKGKDFRGFSPAILLFIFTIVPSIWILELHHQENRNNEPQCMKFHSWEDVKNMINSNGSHHNQSGGRVVSSVCPDDWILGLHQALLILLILGKWVLPLGGGITRDELSQLLLIFVGTAADILEFSTETLSDVKENSPELVYIILAVWSWSMLQFPPHLAVVSPDEDAGDASDSLLSRRSTDIWVIMESLFIQDGPFLVVRLLVLIHYQLFHLMLLFFTFKNFLVVILNLYRLAVICYDYRKGSKNYSY